MSKMADDTGGFVKPQLKRGLKKPPGAATSSDPPEATTGGATVAPTIDFESSASGSQSLLPGFSPSDAKQAFNSPPSQILSYIYLGSQYNAASKKQLGQLQIKRILDLKERHVKDSDDNDLNVHAVPMSDHGDTAITEVLPECFNTIEQARSANETILVHCRGGVNRSATVVLAYLMKHHSMTLKQAWEHVKNARPAISPVMEYMRQLRSYEESLFGTVSLEEQEVVQPLSLSERIGAWRGTNRKINSGSLPADLSLPRDPFSPSDLPDAAVRANTSPIRRFKHSPPASAPPDESEEDTVSEEDPPQE